MVVYIDSVFLLNSLLDGLLLYFTGCLAGAERRLRRLIPAAALGGFYAAAVFFPWGAVLTLPAAKALSGLLLVFLAYGCRRRFWRLCAVFFGLSLVLGGTVLACGFLLHTELYHGGAYLLPVRFELLAASAAACFLGLFLFSRTSAHHQAAGELVDVHCEIMGKPVFLRALRDTGNTLCDPLTGAPVLVAEAAALAEVWPERLRPVLASPPAEDPARVLEGLAAEADAPNLRLLTYRSVGEASGLLLACTAESARIGTYRAPRLTVALSPTPVAYGKEYDALWGGPV